MNFFQRVRLVWRLLWYRGPWLPRFDEDEPDLFQYPPSVLPDFPASGWDDGPVRLKPIETPMLSLVPRPPSSGAVYDWKPITTHFNEDNDV